MKLTRSILAILTASLVSPSISPANEVREMSLSEKVEASDQVVIARTSQIAAHCVRKSSCATLEVLSQLKGEGGNPVTLLFNGDIAEANPQCCIVGDVYLMFLKKVDGGYYRSTNGPYGVYPTQEVKPW